MIRVWRTFSTRDKSVYDEFTKQFIQGLDKLKLSTGNEMDRLVASSTKIPIRERLILPGEYVGVHFQQLKPYLGLKKVQEYREMAGMFERLKSGSKIVELTNQMYETGIQQMLSTGNGARAYKIVMGMLQDTTPNAPKPKQQSLTQVMQFLLQASLHSKLDALYSFVRMQQIPLSVSMFHVMWTSFADRQMTESIQLLARYQNVKGHSIKARKAILAGRLDTAFQEMQLGVHEAPSDQAVVYHELLIQSIRKQKTHLALGSFHRLILLQPVQQHLIRALLQLLVANYRQDALFLIDKIQDWTVESLEDAMTICIKAKSPKALNILEIANQNNIRLKTLPMDASVASLLKQLELQFDQELLQSILNKIGDKEQQILLFSKHLSQINPLLFDVTICEMIPFTNQSTLEEWINFFANHHLVEINDCLVQRLAQLSPKNVKTDLKLSAKGFTSVFLTLRDRGYHLEAQRWFQRIPKDHFAYLLIGHLYFGHKVDNVKTTVQEMESIYELLKQFDTNEVQERLSVFMTKTQLY